MQIWLIVYTKSFRVWYNFKALTSQHGNGALDLRHKMAFVYNISPIVLLGLARTRKSMYVYSMLFHVDHFLRTQSTPWQTCLADCLLFLPGWLSTLFAQFFLKSSPFAQNAISTLLYKYNELSTKFHKSKGNYMM